MHRATMDREDEGAGYADRWTRCSIVQWFKLGAFSAFVEDTLDAWSFRLGRKGRIAWRGDMRPALGKASGVGLDASVSAGGPPRERASVCPVQIALQAAEKSKIRSRSGRLVTEPCVWWKLRFCNS